MTLSPQSTSDDARWQSVSCRDRAADGTFYYAVRTTGIYCRPSCAARLARRENVQFYASCADAAQAGFRPCKRCRPNEPTLGERRAAAIAAACRQIEEADELPTLEILAESAGMSPFHFHRIFKSLTGVTPKAYSDAHRAQRVRQVLTQAAPIGEAIYESGFNSNSRFYAASAQMLGMTPTTLRRGGPGAMIRFAIGECWLGPILVAATEKGICAVLIGDDPETLLRDLEDRFPKAQIQGGEEDFEQWVARVIGLIDVPKQPHDLPLDIQGTAFQQRVWQALRDIPLGSTATYTEIAQRIGQPSAVRAVAQACASNPIAVAIPCHRVVRTDGSLSGYRWGIERKSKLLKHEGARD